MFNFIAYFTVALWPFFMLIVLTDFGPGIPDVSILRAILALVLPIYLLYLLIKQRHINVDMLLKFGTIYVVYLFLNLFANGIAVNARLLERLLDIFLLPCFLYFWLINLRPQKRYLLSSVMLGGTFMGMLGVAETLFQTNLYGPADIRMAGTFYRTNGPFDDGIVFSSAMLFFLPFAYYCYQRGLANRHISVVCLLFCSVASALNLSRACLIVEVLILLILLVKWRMLRLVVFVYFSTLLIFIPLYLTHDAIQETGIYADRVRNVGSIVGRYELYRYLAREYVQHPIFGVGFHQIATKMNPHSTYLQYLVELGLVGLCFFLMFIYSGFVLVHRAARRKSLDSNYYKAIVSTLLIVVLIPFTVSCLDSLPMMMQYLIMIACYQHMLADKDVNRGPFG